MAGTTNLLVWNPTGANQESDAAYLADSQRSGGAVDPSIFQAMLANKAFFQWSTFLTALFTAFANKGFTTSDANLGTLTAQCANFLTTADIRGLLRLVGFAPTLTFNSTAYDGFQVVLTGNLTSFSFDALTIGQEIALAFTQDGVGGRTVTWPAVVLSPGTVDGTPNLTSMQKFKVLNDNKLHPLGPMTVS